MDAESYFDHEIAKIKTGVALVSPAPHQSIFKYISLGQNELSWNRLVQTLNGSLAGSNVNYLNDPFEVSPIIMDDLTEHSVQNAIGRVNFWENFGTLGPPNKQDTRNIEFLREESEIFLSNVKRKTKVICFSARYDSPLLWAHYANGYQGACLHFYAGGLLGYRTSSKLYFVNYSNYRKIYPMSLALALSQRGDRTGLKRAESDYLMYYHKSSEWAYEAEIRAIYDETNLPDGINFTKNNLASIIIGPKFSEENLEILREKISNSSVHSLPIFRAKVSKTSYSIEVGFDEQI